jgi:hypothetical protein
MKENKADQKDVECVRCKRTNVEIQEVPDRVRTFLRSHAIGESIFDRVCSYCLNDFNDFVNSPTVYLHKKKIEMAEKVERWPVRTDILKSGFRAFRLRDFNEARKCYEEYISIVCKSFDNMSLDQVSVAAFSKYSRAEEVNTFALVLWDLVVLMDKSNDPLLTMYSTKFVEFANASTATKSLQISLRNYEKTANNKKLVRKLWGEIGGRGNCFIATKVFQDPFCYEVAVLQAFRDQHLVNSWFGRCFVKTYNLVSPILIEIFPDRLFETKLLRSLLLWLVGAIEVRELGLKTSRVSE